MSFGGNSVAQKKRKVFYDDHNGIFKTETAIEMLKRQCKYTARMADVLNRCEETRLRATTKSVDAGKHIFELKTDKELMMYKENLRDHKAYIQVLENISREREKTEYDDKYGKYGPGVNKIELEHAIQQQLREMSPTVIRKRNANLLLSQRKKMEVFNRNLKTPEIFAMSRSKRSKSESPDVRKTSPKPKTKTPKLILPPITVSLSKQDSKVKFADSSSPNVKNEDDVENDIDKTRSNNVSEQKELLPSVFVTQIGNS